MKENPTARPKFPHVDFAKAGRKSLEIKGGGLLPGKNVHHVRAVPGLAGEELYRTFLSGSMCVRDEITRWKRSAVIDG